MEGFNMDNLNNDSASKNKNITKQDPENKSFSNFSVDDFKSEWNAIIQEGLLDGRIKLYHGTKLKNKKSILDRGLLGKYALDEHNITNSVNPKWGKLEGRDLVYLSKNTLMPNIIKRSHNRKGEKGTLLELSIPYDEYGKLKITDNPETRGENLKQKQDLAVKLYKKQNGDKKLDRDLEKYLYKILPDLFYNTVVVEGDIKPKFIIGSKKYSKNSLGEAIKYISDHPERFGSGVLRGLKTPKKLFD